MKAPVKIPTDRKFGFTFTIVFAILGGWLLWHGNRHGLIAMVAAAAFAAIAAAMPRLLHPLNVAWMYFGFLLGKIVSPIVLGMIFVIVLVPVGLLFRLIGRDALQRKLDPDRKTYWINRTPPGPAGDNFPRQF